MRHIRKEMVCDLGPEPATVTRLLVIGDTKRLLDLCALHDRDLLAATERYLAAGRTPPSARRAVMDELAARTPSGSRPLAARARAREIREWGRENGKRVPDKGRLPGALVREYEASL